MSSILPILYGCNFFESKFSNWTKNPIAAACRIERLEWHWGHGYVLKACNCAVPLLMMMQVICWLMMLSFWLMSTISILLMCKCQLLTFHLWWCCKIIWKKNEHFYRINIWCEQPCITEGLMGLNFRFIMKMFAVVLLLGAHRCPAYLMAGYTGCNDFCFCNSILTNHLLHFLPPTCSLKL